MILLKSFKRFLQKKIYLVSFQQSNQLPKYNLLNFMSAVFKLEFNMKSKMFAFKWVCEIEEVCGFLLQAHTL